MDFDIVRVNYKDRIRNLDVESSGEVKSKKYFPVYNFNGKEYIFKPLSKSKPFCNPSFALSEVFWSNVINKYFDEKTPIYKLSICDGYEDEEFKYRNQGTLVPNLIDSNQKLVNLLEYFKENNDPSVSIDKYINYCGKFYDYTCIFNSKLITQNIILGKKLAYQVLLSILKGDINYHYENVNFIYENNKIKDLAPSIDHEFSSCFMYPDNKGLFLLNLNSLLDLLDSEKVNSEFDTSWPFTSNKKAILDNINLIIEEYNDIVIDFIDKLDLLLYDIGKFKFEIDNSYFYPFSSFDFEQYKKEYNLSKIYNIKNEKIVLDSNDYFKNVIYSVILLANSLKNNLNKKIDKNSKLVLKSN